MVPDAFVRAPRAPAHPQRQGGPPRAPEPPRPRGGRRVRRAAHAGRGGAGAIWSEVLGVERVGRDDFFDLGGHSLRPRRWWRACGRSWAPRCRWGRLRACPRPRSWPALVEAAARWTRRRASPAAPAGRPLPLSYPQEAIWFFQQLKPGMRSYNFQATVRVDGALDARGAGARAHRDRRRHEIFRTTFPAVDGGPRAAVHRPWSRAPPVRTCATSRRRRQAELGALLREEFAPRSTWSTLPLVRWTLFRAGGRRARARRGAPPGARRVELRRLPARADRAVRRLRARRASRSPSRGVQFGDYAAWQRAWMRAPRRARSWTGGAAAGGRAPVLELPADRPRPAEMSFRGSAHRVRLSAGAVRGGRRVQPAPRGHACS
jgi:hypothetical protein